MTTTTRADFDAAIAAGHRVVPVLRERFADAETPVGIYRKLAAGRPGTFLLESAEPGGIWSRWSFVGVGTFGTLTTRGDETVWLAGTVDAERALGDAIDAAPLAALDALYRRWSTPRIPGHPPLTGGLVGYIGWDAVRQIERLPHRPPVDAAVDVPVQSFGLVSELLALDHRHGTVTLIASVLNDGDAAPEALWADAQRRLDALEARLGTPSAPDVAAIDLSVRSAPRHRGTQEAYEAMVVRAKELIREGDVFQVVLSQRFDHDLTAEPLDVYRVLRALNPSPYMYLLSLEDADGHPFAVVGSSPEALVKVTDGRATSHPIAGSRPRGETPELDDAHAEELLRDPKERAEHLMLVDLARNDLAKVGVAGTVELTQFMVIERYSHIMHIVSTVEADLREGVTPIDVFRATFPAGTLSGAPKPRALEIIDELESVARGVYGGVVGYFDLAGDADLAIAIRTTVIKDGVATVQAGAGLVAESVPTTEHEETMHKAAAPLRAIAIANALGR
ncbi:MAG TPA: anthranilate synthase component I [Microbacteriaceae bacterium]|nr:anthranilate synthase component I [Microbacteriaceae bacterium]